ncbi:hypothetical protein FOZ63_022508, partial [Perkinsus olseni]
MPVNASTMELEGHWDDRHAVVFAKDNEDIYTDQRSFFDRLRDRPDFSVGGLSSGSEGSSLWLSLSVEEPTEPVKASWKLTQTTLHNRSREEDGGLGPKSYSLPKSVFRSSFYEPSSSAGWKDRHHIAFSKGNPSFSKNLRSYFDRPRELSVASAEDFLPAV